MDALLQHIAYCSESIKKQGSEQDNLLHPWQRQHLAVFSNAKGALQAGRGVDEKIMTFLQEYNPNRPDLMEKTDVPGAAPPLRLTPEGKPKRRASRAAPAPPKRSTVAADADNAAKTAPASPPASRAVGRHSSTVTRSGPPPLPPDRGDEAPLEKKAAPGSPLAPRAKTATTAASAVPLAQAAPTVSSSSNPFADASAAQSQQPPVPPASSAQPRPGGQPPMPPASNAKPKMASASSAAAEPPGTQTAASGSRTALLPPGKAGAQHATSPSQPPAPAAATAPDAASTLSDLPSLPGLDDEEEDDGWDALPPLADENNDDDYLREKLPRRSKDSGTSQAEAQPQPQPPPPPPPPPPPSAAPLQDKPGSPELELPRASTAFARSPTLQRAVRQAQPVDVDAPGGGQQPAEQRTPKQSLDMGSAGTPSLDAVLASVHNTLVQRVREETGISFEQARMSVLTVLSALWEPIATTEQSARAVASAVAGPTEVLGRDARDLEHMFQELTAMKEDTQQRNWAVEDDAEKICQALERFRSILQVRRRRGGGEREKDREVNGERGGQAVYGVVASPGANTSSLATQDGDPEMSRRIVREWRSVGNTDDYEIVTTLVAYFQMVRRRERQ